MLGVENSLQELPYTRLCIVRRERERARARAQARARARTAGHEALYRAEEEERARF